MHAVPDASLRREDGAREGDHAGKTERFGNEGGHRRPVAQFIVRLEGGDGAGAAADQHDFRRVHPEFRGILQNAVQGAEKVFGRHPDGILCRADQAERTAAFGLLQAEPVVDGEGDESVIGQAAAERAGGGVFLVVLHKAPSVDENDAGTPLERVCRVVEVHPENLCRIHGEDNAPVGLLRVARKGE